jgi:hypothetical protein
VADEMEFDGMKVGLGGTLQDPNDRDLSNFPKQHGKRLDVYRREGDGWANVGYEERNAVLSLRDLAMQGNAGVAVWSSNDLSQQEIEFFAVP